MVIAQELESAGLIRRDYAVSNNPEITDLSKRREENRPW